MEKEFNVRDLDQKELKETNGGSIFLTLLLISSIIYVVGNVVDNVVDALNSNPYTAIY